jgi:hypothetical protein
MTKDWIKEGDEVSVVTSDEANALMAQISDDGEVMTVWLTIMAQLRPSKEKQFPVDVHPDDLIYAEELVGLGLLVRSPDDVDSYLVPRSMAYADSASEVFKRTLN